MRDADGNRWIRCKFCGKIAMEGDFSSYGGKGHMSFGTCKDCSANNPEVCPRYLSGMWRQIARTKRTIWKIHGTQQLSNM